MDLICRPGPNPFPSQQERKWGRIAGALLLGLTLLCAACDGSVADGGKQPLRVFAAASLRDVLDEAARAFESAHGGKVVVITGGSNLVADQLFAGAPGDLLISAGAQEVDRLIAAGILDGESRRAVFENQLVVVAPTGSIDRFSEDPMAALLQVGRLSIAHPGAVPAGRYAKAWLSQQGLWDLLAPRAIYALDVRAAMAAVASGGVEAGVVYRTDAASSESVSVVYEVPKDDGPDVVYSGAISLTSSNVADAALFLEFITDEFRGAAQRHGFGVLAKD